eukprot:6187325-Pleurochrysis_carterae.AAC.3
MCNPPSSYCSAQRRLCRFVWIDVQRVLQNQVLSPAQLSTNGTTMSPVARARGHLMSALSHASSCAYASVARGGDFPFVDHTCVTSGKTSQLDFSQKRSFRAATAVLCTCLISSWTTLFCRAGPSVRH